MISHYIRTVSKHRLTGHAVLWILPIGFHCPSPLQSTVRNSCQYLIGCRLFEPPLYSIQSSNLFVLLFCIWVSSGGLFTSFGLSRVAGWSDGKEDSPLGSKKCCNAGEPLSSQGIALTLQLKLNRKWSPWQPPSWFALVCVCVCVCACAIVDGTLWSILSMPCCHSGHELGGSYGFDRFWHPAREDFQAGLNKCLCLQTSQGYIICLNHSYTSTPGRCTCKSNAWQGDNKHIQILQEISMLLISIQRICESDGFNVFQWIRHFICSQSWDCGKPQTLTHLMIFWFILYYFIVILLWSVKHCQTSCAGHRTRIAAGYWRISNLQQGSCQFVHAFQCALFQCLLQFDVTWCNRRKITTEFFKMLQAGGSGVSYCAKYLLDQTIFPCFLHEWFVQGLPNVS